MGQKLIVANLKMQQTIEDVSEYLKIIQKKTNLKKRNVVICPTSIFVPYFMKQGFSVGLQNIFFRSSGAYTGEVSPLQAKSMGINYVILGHSERRSYFNENDIDINNKMKEALKNNLKVILCIGETLEEKNLLKTDRVLKRQLMVGLKEISLFDFDNIFIAYEPIWAIGTNIIPEVTEIEKTTAFIKNIVEKLYKASNIKVLYGGSVNDTNIKELQNVSNISGYLIGGSALDAKKLAKIVDIVDKD